MGENVIYQRRYSLEIEKSNDGYSARQTKLKKKTWFKYHSQRKPIHGTPKFLRFVGVSQYANRIRLNNVSSRPPFNWAFSLCTRDRDSHSSPHSRASLLLAKITNSSPLFPRALCFSGSLFGSLSSYFFSDGES